MPLAATKTTPAHEDLHHPGRYNTLRAFKHIIENANISIDHTIASSNRINGVGDGLEYYIKDAYSGILGRNLEDHERDEIYSKTFSWLGNSSNPPDSILHGGDGIEVKKIQNSTSSIALNSSSPKNKLYATDSRIARGAKLAEKWSEKDIVYAIGTVTGQRLQRLWLIYGDCYAASKDVYDRLSDTISAGVTQLPDIEFQSTNELARVNKVDPLGITKLRIRGMWHIENPSRVYRHLTPTPTSADTTRQFYLLMREDKYQTFPLEDRISLENNQLSHYQNTLIRIKNPDNPAQLVEARFISYEA